MSLVFKKAEKASIVTIQEILQKEGLPYQDVNSENIEFFLAFENKTFIGIIGVERYNNIGLLRSMVIDEKFRNKGFGNKLCRKLMEYSKNSELSELYLLTCTAKVFFEKLGFKSVSRLDVPDEIKETKEFSEFCPCNATCLKIEL